MTRSILGTSVAIALTGAPSFADEIRTRTMDFENEGSTLAGTLYLPADFEDGDELPAVIVTGAWTSVQQQMPAE